MTPRAVIWDWNGTLLDDLKLCVQTINQLLARRNLPLVDTFFYREVFSFPVKDYYRRIGFDFEQEEFEVPALEFTDLYNAGINHCRLHSSAKKTIRHFHDLQIRQFVLSAMQHDLLEKTLTSKGIRQFFEKVAGLDDHFAVSKLEQGRRLLKEIDEDPREIFLIGDTIHDYEVATELGVGCILIADGHQSKERLQKTGVQVLDALEELYRQITV